MLFKDWKRTYDDIRRRGTSIGEFLDISSRPIAELLRKHYNEWGRLLEDDKEFMKMFFSRDNQQHYSAVFELLLATLLSRSGFMVTKIPHTAGKRPDFKISHDKIPDLYLECTLSGNSYESLTDKKKKEMVEDVIEELTKFGYFVNIEIIQTSGYSFAKRKLISFLFVTAKTLDTMSDTAVLNKRVVFTDAGWNIVFSFIRKPSPDIKRSLGMVIDPAKEISSENPIYNALNDKKPSKYKIDAFPFIICVNSSDMFADQFSISEALLGYPADSIPVSKSERGFFLTHGKPINTTASAVLFCRKMDSSTLDRAALSLWHNPYASMPIPLNIFPFTEYYYAIESDMLRKQAIEKTPDLFAMLGMDRGQYLRSL